MNNLVKSILDWSEVWSLGIPLAILIWKGKQPGVNKPVVYYIYFALFTNLCIDLIWKLRTAIPEPYNGNNYLYNIHSIVRFLLFSVYFIRLRQPFLVKTKKLLVPAFVLFLVINFSFFEHFFNYQVFSSRLLSVEAIFLLFYTLQYYLFMLQVDEGISTNRSDFWIATGLGIYVAVNFFIFLLYNKLTKELLNFAVIIWNVHNVSYILLNIFLAKAFYEAKR
jgi:hypothetical protein